MEPKMEPTISENNAQNKTRIEVDKVCNESVKLIANGRSGNEFSHKVVSIKNRGVDKCNQMFKYGCQKIQIFENGTLELN